MQESKAKSYAGNYDLSVTPKEYQALVDAGLKKWVHKYNAKSGQLSVYAGSTSAINQLIAMLEKAIDFGATSAKEVLDLPFHFAESQESTGDWGSSDMGAAMRYMWQVIDRSHSGRATPESMTAAAQSAAETYHTDMGYHRVEDAERSLIAAFLRRPDGIARHNITEQGNIMRKPIKEFISTDTPTVHDVPVGRSAPLATPSNDHEGEMAKVQLRVMMHSIRELYDLLHTDDNLPEWVQNKITLAMSNIGAAKDYVISNPPQHRNLRESKRSQKLSESVVTHEEWKSGDNKFEIVLNMLGLRHEKGKPTEVYISWEAPGKPEVFKKVGSYTNESDLAALVTKAHTMAEDFLRPKPAAEPTPKKGRKFNWFGRHAATTESKNPYAIGMAQAKKEAGIKGSGEVPKKVVTRAHEIAKAIEDEKINEAEAKRFAILERISVFEQALARHKKEFAKQIREGKESDTLGVGYGVKGEYILGRLAKMKAMYEQYNNRSISMCESALRSFLLNEETQKEVRNLAETAKTTPYGVIYTDDKNMRVMKFFETARHRSYWLKLNEANDPVKVNPTHIAGVIRNLSKAG